MFKSYLKAIRPKTLPASIGPVLIGLSVSYYTQEFLNIIDSILTVVCALTLQIISNLVNDYFDFKKGTDKNRVHGFDRVMQSGLIKEKTMRSIILWHCIFALSIGSILMLKHGIVIVLIGLISLLMAFFYTAGPSLSYFAMGELLAFIFFGPIPVFGTYYIQTQRLDYNVLLFGIAPGLISSAIMGINNLRDIVSDRSSSKMTIAILIGKNNMKILILFLIFLTFCFPLLYVKEFHNLILLTSLSTIFFFKTWKSIYLQPEGSKLNLDLANTGKYMFIYSFMFSSILMAIKCLK